MAEVVSAYAQAYFKDAILVFLGILGGGFVSLYFYRKSARLRRISFHVSYDRFTWVDRKKYDTFQISFNDREVSNPHITHISIWNSGNETLQRSDISTQDPLLINLENGEILTATIIKQTRVAIDPKLTIGAGRKNLIDYDFLDPGDGFLIEILFDSTNFTHADQSKLISGTIKNTEISNVSDVTYDDHKNIYGLAGTSALSAIAVLFIVILYMQIIDAYEASAFPLIISKIISIIMSIAIVAGCIATIYSRMFGSRMPRSISKHDFISERHDLILAQSREALQIERAAYLEAREGDVSMRGNNRG